MNKKEIKKKEFAKRPIDPKMKLLSIVIVHNSFKKRGKFLIKERENLAEVKNENSKHRCGSLPGQSY